MKITIITGQHLVSNPRVWKEANALAERNHEVTVLTLWYDENKVQQDQQVINTKVKYISALDLRKSTKNKLNRFRYRILFKLAHTLKSYLNFESKYLLCYGPKTFLKKALKINSDLYIGHQETGLLIGNQLIKKGNKVAFDFEDWYSEDYLVKTRPINYIKKLEKFALDHGYYVSCPSQAMADALQFAYSTQVKPFVLYNGFYKVDPVFQTIQKKRPNSLVWFSQVIGPGRGLENLINAIRTNEKGLELHLLGKIEDNYKNELISICGKLNLFFHEPVLPNEILPFLNQFSIGVALEKTLPLSRNVTITNKILQYIQAGIPVIASETLGQTEVANLCSNYIKTFNQDNSDELNKLIDFFQKEFQKPEKIIACFNENFAFENQVPVLYKICEQAIA